MPVRSIRPTPPSTAAVQLREPVVKILTAQGVIAGAFGAGSVALWFLIVDVLTRTAMYAPSLVGSVLLYGTAPSAGAGIDLGAVAGFSLVHFCAFALFGTTVTFGLHWLGVRAASVVGVATIALALNGGFLVAEAALAPGIGAALGWLAVGCGNAAAAISMALCLSALPSVTDYADR